MDLIVAQQRRDEDMLIALDVPEYAKIIDLSAGVIRMQFRRTPDSVLCDAELNTLAIQSGPLGGQYPILSGHIWYDPLYKVLTFWMSKDDIRLLNLQGDYVMRARYELYGFFYDIVDGTITFTPAIVRP